MEMGDARANGCSWQRPLADERVEPLGKDGRAAVLAVNFCHSHAPGALLLQVARMANGALRCLALAKKPDLPAQLAKYDGTDVHPAHKQLADPNR